MNNKRTLMIIRHAKAGWASPLKSDYDRELNEKGKHDAPEAGKKLKQLNIVPDLIISSPSKRTKQTAKRIAEELKYNCENIRWEEKLYHCIPSVFEEVMQDVSQDVHTLFVVAHNPGVTEFVNHLSADFGIDNMPTCGVVGVHFEATDWHEFSDAERKVFLYDYPGKES